MLSYFRFRILIAPQTHAQKWSRKDLGVVPVVCIAASICVPEAFHGMPLVKPRFLSASRTALRSASRRTSKTVRKHVVQIKPKCYLDVRVFSV